MRLACLTALVLAISVFGRQAQAVQFNGYNCTDHKIALEYLSKKYNEQPVGIGLSDDGGVVQILASKDGRSWSIIVTKPNGITCMVAHGETWEQFARQAPSKRT